MFVFFSLNLQVEKIFKCEIRFLNIIMLFRSLLGRDSYQFSSSSVYFFILSYRFITTSNIHTKQSCSSTIHGKIFLGSHTTYIHIYIRLIYYTHIPSTYTRCLPWLLVNTHTLCINVCKCLWRGLIHWWPYLTSCHRHRAVRKTSYNAGYIDKKKSFKEKTSEGIGLSRQKF